MIRLLWCLILIELHVDANLKNCPGTNVKFEKVLGLRPPNASNPVLLYQLEKGTPLRPITSECIAKCHSDDECASFVLYYSEFRCYWFKNDIKGAEESENIIDEDTAWFIKVCFKKVDCGKLWTFERIPGAVLIGNNTKTLPRPLTRTDCQQHCLNETEFLCRSVKYKILSNNYLSSTEILGTCTLSNADRHLLPNSYRVSGYDEEYFENQCWNNRTVERQDFENEFCAYEEYENVTLSHSDILFEKRTKDECQHLCEEFTNFVCRGFSIINNVCWLHSEDSKIHGPKILKENAKSTYYEKARCLNISVSCTETYMTIQYVPEIKFFGKVYMQGFSENPQCYATGQGKFTVISLKLPLLASKCGIIKAAGNLNRTLLSGTAVIQYNSIIQTQGDRIIKVGCIFGNDSKILIGTGVKISSSSPNHGSMLLNNSTFSTRSPEVEMRVLDLNTHEEVSDSQIGQELELVIEFKSKNSTYDIWASHLVAMTEKSEESIFLLDDRGCPTNLNIFPPLEKVITATSRQLVAAFQAFKFASSPFVRFSVLIQFCPNDCPPVNCDHNIASYGRRKREIVSHSIQTINGTTIVKLNRSEFERMSGLVNEMPLEYVMIVRDPKFVSDRLVFGDNKILVAGYDYTTNEVCLDYSLVIGLIVTWILIQICFVLGCIMLVKRYKRYYQHECTKQSLEELHKNFGIGFSNLENRRVHWADNDNIL
ncbi:uncharacterized protein LOC108908940 isoform X2 [Anoplophora glabripennis]|uniref:uncharacterized protein LOC108908940 isoform X2 n=1 Tax=Anoplophora glabripennis TaxID=217634 RepID=UPI0008748248|nr:uncharacterized protein LOC108908940 isoform X2 [Anoplophora glabripennis]